MEFKNILYENRDGILYLTLNRPEVRNALSPEMWQDIRDAVAQARRDDSIRVLIISGAGLPVDLPRYVEGSDVKIAPIVSPPKAAKVILKHWDRHYHRTADLVVIEGPKAGGHLGYSPEEIQAYEDTGYDEKIKEILDIVREYEDRYGRHIPVVFGGGVFVRCVFVCFGRLLCLRVFGPAAPQYTQTGTLKKIEGGYDVKNNYRHYCYYWLRLCGKRGFSFTRSSRQKPAGNGPLLWGKTGVYGFFG